MRRYLKSKSSFTFLEVLATLVILSIALIPILTWVPTSIQTKIKTERKTKAIFLCQSKIEELRYRIINDFSYSADTGGSFNSPNQDFSYTVSYNLVGTSLKTISVKVEHIDNPGDETVFDTQIASR